MDHLDSHNFPMEEKQKGLPSVIYRRQAFSVSAQISVGSAYPGKKKTESSAME